MNRYRKPDDEYLLNEIRQILKQRPTYGYKRVTAMMNKKRSTEGLKRINKKRVYRIMDMNGLLLEKNTSPRNSKGTGSIITLHSNTRWCSDGFEIHCFNGEKVYIAFSLDCHDRECIAYVANTKPLLALDIQSLMLMSVEKRFGIAHAPRQIQWLSDRGGIYRAHLTKQIARQLNLKSCFTAPHSPESNGMSEAFVGTIKRDYVYVSDCYDAKTVLELLPVWIEDYNNVAPHSGLGMKSPVEYRKSINLGV